MYFSRRAKNNRRLARETPPYPAQCDGPSWCLVSGIIVIVKNRSVQNFAQIGMYYRKYSGGAALSPRSRSALSPNYAESSDRSSPEERMLRGLSGGGYYWACHILKADNRNDMHLVSAWDYIDEPPSSWRSGLHTG